MAKGASFRLAKIIGANTQRPHTRDLANGASKQLNQQSQLSEEASSVELSCKVIELKPTGSTSTSDSGKDLATMSINDTNAGAKEIMIPIATCS